MDLSLGSDGLSFCMYLCMYVNWPTQRQELADDDNDDDGDNDDWKGAGGVLFTGEQRASWNY